MLDKLTRLDFSELAPGTLRVEHGGASLPLDVVQLRDLPRGSPRAEPFAVILSGPASPLLQQGIHPLVHPVHGRLDVFIVPVARDNTRTTYEIIFN